MAHPILSAIAALLAQAATVAPQAVPYDPPPVADLTGVASAADMAALIASTKAAIAHNGKTFVWQPLLEDGTNTVALEYWTAAARPAIHPAEAEYTTVIEGNGTLLTGGTLVGAQMVRPGFVDGDRIVGGTLRHLHKGDTVLIPAGVPHWFGIPTGETLVLLGIKVPTPSPAKPVGSTTTPVPRHGQTETSPDNT